VTDIIKNSDYRNWLRDLKLQIKTGQVKAALSVNSRMIALYWDLGRQITEKQESAKWGSGFIEQLSRDLREEFPEITGFSKDNLLKMKKFYIFYQHNSCQAYETVAQPVQLLGKSYPQIVEQVVPQLQLHVNQRDTKMEQVVPELALVPWGHHILLLKKVKDIKQALFYLDKIV
jgi:predicted nuclease of restriction endonuclease-like (RecB) superfamily